jgi:coenzyme Q-binding protein COQ10
MTPVRVERVVAFTPAAMFELVSDVKRYPEFIPWVRSMHLKTEFRQGADWAGVATAEVGFKGLSERFSTRVLASAGERTVLVSLVDGPFRHLSNRWVFQDHPDGCRILFELAYEFRNPILQALARANTRIASEKIIAAFLAEARRRASPAAPGAIPGSQLPA